MVRQRGTPESVTLNDAANARIPIRKRNTGTWPWRRVPATRKRENHASVSPPVLPRGNCEKWRERESSPGFGPRCSPSRLQIRSVAMDEQALVPVTVAGPHRRSTGFRVPRSLSVVTGESRPGVALRQAPWTLGSDCPGRDFARIEVASVRAIGHSRSLNAWKATPNFETDRERTVRSWRSRWPSQRQRLGQRQ